MKNYIKPTANVIEMAVKERLSASAREARTRSYNVRGKVKDINTTYYASMGASKIDVR